MTSPQCAYLMVLDYLAGALVPSCRHVDDEIDEERVGDEVQVEEEPMPLCQLAGIQHVTSILK